MNHWLKNSLIISAFAVAGCSPEVAKMPEIGRMEFASGSIQHVVRGDQIDWNPCPGNMPPGCEAAVLEGDLQAEDFFVVRLRVDRDFYLPPHSHPKEERLTVLSGAVAVDFGDNAERGEAVEFAAGDYYVTARDKVHSVWIAAGTLVQLAGIGPWKVKLVNDPGAGQ